MFFGKRKIPNFLKFSKQRNTLTDLTVFAGSTRRTLAHVSSLRQDVAGGTMLARFADAGIQRLFTISTGELRRANASVVWRLVLLHSVIAMVVIVLVLELVIVIALAGDAAFFRVLLGPRFLD